jgi:hypothetical protein
VLRYFRILIKWLSAIFLISVVSMSQENAAGSAVSDTAYSQGIVVDTESSAQSSPVINSSAKTDYSENVTKLDKMVVTADRRQKLMQTAQSLTIITPDAWIGTAKSIADVLAEQTGIQSRRFGGMGSYQTVSIRGVEGSEVLVLIDGIPLNSAMGGAVDLGKLNPSRFSRIEVFRGFLPARFGFGGLGGAINLVTVEPKQGAGADIYSQIRNYHSQEHSILAGHALKNRLQTVALLSYSDSDNDFMYLDRNNTAYNTGDDSVRTMENSQYAASYFMLHPSVLLNNGLRLHALASASRFKAHQPGSEGHSNKTAYNAGKVFDINVRLENESSPDNIIIEPAISYIFRQAYRFYTSLDSAVGASHSTIGGPNSFTEIGSNEQVLTVPVTVTYLPTDFLKFESSLSASGADINPTVNTTGGSNGDWHSREASGVLALDAVFKSNLFSATGGGRLKAVYSETEGGLDGYTNLTVPASENTTMLWSVLGGASMKCADSAVLFYANTGRFSNHPSLLQRYGAQGAHNPNPTLVPETGFSSEAGVKMLFQKQYMEICGFYNRSWNKILTVFDGSQSGSINCPGARVFGLEASLVLSLMKYLHMDNRITWQKTKNLSSIYNWYGNMLPDEPALDINESVVLGHWKGLSLKYGIDLKSRYFRDPGNTGAFQVPKDNFNKEDKSWEVFHECRLEWKPFEELTMGLSASRLTSDLLVLQEYLYTGESGYQWVLVPANQVCFSVGYSF